MKRVLLGLGFVMVSAAAAPPPGGPVALGPAQQRQLELLEQKGEQAAQKGEFEQAHAVAVAIVKLRMAWQGERHWQTIDARRDAEDWLRLTKVALKDRPEAFKAQRLNNEGMWACNRGRYREGLEKVVEALAIRRKVLGEEHPQTALSYNNVAYCLEALGQPAKALPLFEKALAIYRKALGEDHPQTALSYNNVAACLKALGQPAKALPLYEKALAIRRKALGEEHPDTAQSYNNVALCLKALGQLAKALPLYEKALAIRRNVLGEEHPDTATSYNNVASCLQALGRVPESILLTQVSLPGREAARFRQADSGFDRSLASTLLSPHAYLAGELPFRGQARNGFRHAEASLARGLLEDLSRDDPEQAKALANLDEQIREVDQLLLPLFGTPSLSAEQARQREDLTRQRRRLMAEQARQASGASTRDLVPLEQIQTALPADAAYLLWIEWKVPGQGNVQPVACLLRHTGPPVWLRVPAQGKGWQDGDAFLPTQAYLALVADSLSAKEREAFIAREPEKFRALAKAAFQPGQGETLTAALRRQRIAPLLPHLKGIKHLFVVPTGRMAAFPVELLAPEFTVSYIPSGSFLHRVLKQHRPLEASSLLALGDPVFTGPAEKAPVPPATGLFIAAVLPGGAASRAGLRPGDVLLRHGEKTLAGLDDLKGAGAGVLSLWRDGKEVAVRVPAGPLGMAIDRLPPAVALARRRELNSSLVLRGTGHPPLPGTAYEVKALAALVKHTTLLLGSAASEQRLDELLAKKQLQTFRLLHLATHGDVNDLLPDQSHLVLAQDTLPNPNDRPVGAKVYDGRLTVQTIRQKWDLDADLVVLSACRTALGKETDSDGLLGFAHAFLARGARCVVLSRWKVDDGATALLMLRFYENLLGTRGKKLGRAAALAEAKDWLRRLSRDEAERREAQLTRGILRGSEEELPPLAKEQPKPTLPEGERPYEHPFFWAAWTLIGDPD